MKYIVLKHLFTSSMYLRKRWLKTVIYNSFVYCNKIFWSNSISHESQRSEKDGMKCGQKKEGRRKGN